MTNPTQQNKEIIKKYWELYDKEHNGVWLMSNGIYEYQKEIINNFLLSQLEQKDQEKDKALAEYKAELAETIQKKLTSSVDFLETEGVPYTEGFETALAEVLSLINSQCQAKNI